MARPRSLPRRLIYSLVPLLLLLTAVELGARLVGWLALESRRPQLEEVKRSEKPRRGSEVNELDGLRVVCVGDSWTYGIGVENHETYPAQLEAVLDDQHQLQTQVINLGQPGAGSLRIARILRSFLAEGDAELVVWLGGANSDPRATAQVEGPGGLLGHSLRPLLSHSASYRLLTQLVARARLRSDPLLHSMEHNTGETIPFFAALEARREALVRNLARVDDLSTAFGAQLLVLTYPVPSVLPHEDWVTHRTTNEHIRQGAAARGLWLLDLERAYDSGGDGTRFLLHGDRKLKRGELDLHPGISGNRLVAERVAAAIALQGR